MKAKFIFKIPIVSIVTLICFWNYASGQLSPVNTTAIGAGSAQDGFEYNGYFLPEYSLGWYYPQGPGVTPSIPPTAYFSSFNGFQFFTATQVRFTLDYNGNVGIGTTVPDSKLAVNGNIHAKEVKVDLTNWPDYVFEPAYTLPSLSNIKAYINKNQHLPEIPSNAQVAREGISLGEMNKLLLKKVEELTLYLIEKDAELKAQGLRIGKLEKLSKKGN